MLLTFIGHTVIAIEDYNSGSQDKIEIKEKNETNTGDIRTKVESEIKIRKGEIEAKIKEKIESNAERIEKIIKFKNKIRENKGIIEFNCKKIIVNEIGQERKEIIIGKMNAKTGLNLSIEDIENGTVGQILRAYLSNGRYADIKIIPDTASEIALKRLRAKCIDRNCSLELKEVGKGNETRLKYELETEKDSNIFFIIKRKMKVIAEIDPETGEVLSIKKPWWAFMAKEKHEDENENEIER